MSENNEVLVFMGLTLIEKETDKHTSGCGDKFWKSNETGRRWELGRGAVLETAAREGPIDRVS